MKLYSVFFKKILISLTGFKKNTSDTYSLPSLCDKEVLYNISCQDCVDIFCTVQRNGDEAEELRYYDAYDYPPRQVF